MINNDDLKNWLGSPEFMDYVDEQTKQEEIYEGRLDKVEKYLETPKNFGKFQSFFHSFMLVTNQMACQGAIDKAKELGFHVLFLSSCMEGESREVAKVHAAIGKEVISSGNPLPRPACVVSGGETVVTVKGDGLGGRNLEFALAAAIEIEGMDNVLMVSLGTDGTDGPTHAAGAIVDGNTIKDRKSVV